MTVTPFPSILPTPPSGLGTATGTTASADPTAAGFAALVASLVAGQLPAGAATATPVATTPAGAAEPSEESSTPEGEAPEDGLPSGINPLPLPGLAALLGAAVPAVTPAAPAPSGDVPDTASAAGVATPAALADLTPRGAAEPEAAPVAPAAAASAASAPAPTAGPVAAEGLPVEAASPAAPTSTSTPAATAAPGTAVPPAAPLPVQGAQPTADAVPVTRQVFPEVTRLVTAGNGTHRVTLTLQPEQLGEVRVTLTVRDGEVLVRMAAGDDAQRALLEGAPELRRVLELAGATDTRIVVRDLAAPGPATGLPTAGGEGRGESGSARHDRTDDQHAGTRGGSSTARDGSNDSVTDSVTAGAIPPRPVDPVTSTRGSGLDVTV